MKRSGPRIEPCGTPNLTWNSFDVLLPILMKWVLLERNDLIQSSADDVMPKQVLLTKVFTMKDTEGTLCKSRTYFEIVTMATVCPGRVWWLLQHFSYILHFKRVK